MSRHVASDELGVRRNEVVRDQARQDLQCDAVTVLPGPSIMLYPDGPLVATGCGRTEEYEQVMCGASLRFVPLHVASPELDRFAAPGCTGYRILALSQYRRVIDVGSHDLACPRDQVEGSLVWTGHGFTPVADGCGKRATYLASGTGWVGTRSLASIITLPP
jgi:hypothetical protein